MNVLILTIQPYALGGVFVLTYLAEHIIPQRKEIIDHKHDLKNILVGVINLVLIAVVGIQFQNAIEWLNNKHFGVLQLFSIPPFISIIIGVLVIDIFMYWWHRINHEWRFLWYFHKFHHTDTKLNSTSALRFHAGELLLSYVKIRLAPVFGSQSYQVPETGFEPARRFQRHHLKVVRLPISPPGHLGFQM